MAPVIHIVRHAEALHNASRQWTIPDPDLTQKGEEQCAQLEARTEQIRRNATHLVASPSLRAIRTCALAFASVAEAGKQILLQPDIQEVAPDQCNIPAPLEAIQEAHGNLVDTTLLTPEFMFRGKGSRLGNEFQAVLDRAREARKWLRNLARSHQGNANIVVVSHGTFIKILTMDPHNTFANAELRSYRFVNWEVDDDDDEAELESIALGQ